ncbi:anti-sigma factor domain-containing protein [uncultured Friedmanniella sp.]|uniref:anti-sigma factor n=1 Tax=uncultured Friedmanniella sp. TaxID=335381 RepID=UPI0035CAF87E
MSEIHGATGSYVLNALDSSELDEFEAHLAVCPTCSQEVVEFCETAAELSLLATIAAPPPALKGSIMSAISGVRVLPPDAPVETAPVGKVAPVVYSPHRAMPVDELAIRRAQRRNRVLSLAVAAAMVVALAMGGWAVSLTQKQQNQIAAPSLETQVYNAPDVKIRQFTLKDGTQASFVASKSLNKAFLTSTSLPDPGAGKTYQLWTLRGKQAIPDNLLSGGKGVDAWFNGDITQASQVALSIEPASGSQQPTADTIQTVATL